MENSHWKTDHCHGLHDGCLVPVLGDLVVVHVNVGVRVLEPGAPLAVLAAWVVNVSQPR